METPKIHKLSNTVDFQLELAIEELLSEVFHEDKYDGILEITWRIRNLKKETKVEVVSKKMAVVPNKRKEKAVYYHVSQEKGVKKL
jgi:hypothetical protein